MPKVGLSEFEPLGCARLYCIKCCIPARDMTVLEPSCVFQIKFAQRRISRISLVHCHGRILPTVWVKFQLSWLFFFSCLPSLLVFAGDTKEEVPLWALLAEWVSLGWAWLLYRKKPLPEQLYSSLWQQNTVEKGGVQSRPCVVCRKATCSQATLSIRWKTVTACPPFY